MKKLVLYLLLFITLLLQQSCQEKFTPELSTAEPLLVVEGHIELSEDFALPPYVILTRSIPFYSEISLEDIENLFVHDALVEVSDGSQSVLLEEYCWENIPEDFQDMIIETVAELEGNTYNFCIYTDLSFSLSVKEGVTYSLHIETDKEVATAHTTIPSFVPLDSVYFAPAPGGHGDSLMELQIVYNDPIDEENFYRYFTSTNQAPFYPGFNSVWNDRFFDGQVLDIPLSKGEPRFSEEVDHGDWGLFRFGDEVILRWLMIDEAHYKFWDSLEFNKVNQGPFGSYTQVKSNIEGAIGIWGGYRSGFYSVVVE